MKKIKIDWLALAIVILEGLLCISAAIFAVKYFYAGSIGYGITWTLLCPCWGWITVQDWKQFEPLTFKK